MVCYSHISTIAWHIQLLLEELKEGLAIALVQLRCEVPEADL